MFIYNKCLHILVYFMIFYILVEMMWTFIVHFHVQNMFKIMFYDFSKLTFEYKQFFWKILYTCSHFFNVFFVAINKKRDTHFTWFNFSIPNIGQIFNQKFSNCLIFFVIQIFALDFLGKRIFQHPMHNHFIFNIVYITKIKFFLYNKFYI